MMKSLPNAALLVILLLFAVPIAFGQTAAQDKPSKDLVHGEGAAPGAGPEAREAAILNAQTNLVMERLEQLVPSRDFSIFATILENAPAYFESYTVVAETHLNDATQVEIEGRILDSDILADASSEAFKRYTEPPRVILYIAEQETANTPQESKQLGVAERKLGDALRKARFDIVDADALREDRSDDALIAMVGQAPEEVATVGRQYRADIILLGQASFKSEPTIAGANFNKVTSDLKLRVIRSIDGALLAEPASQAIVNSARVSEAAEQSLQDAADKVFGEVMSACVVGMLNTQSKDVLNLTIEGLGQKERLDLIVAKIQTFPGVRSVETAFVSSEVAKLKLTYTGRVGALVDRLSAAKFAGFRLDPHTVLDRAIMASVIAQ